MLLIISEIRIPKQNEEDTILNILNIIKNQNFIDFDYEVIVINDGSTDKTLEILNKNFELYNKLISLDTNSGKGAAIIEGLKQTTGDYIIFQDADLEYNPEDFLSF